jgi:hypothetical protein
MTKEPRDVDRCENAGLEITPEMIAAGGGIQSNLKGQTAVPIQLKKRDKLFIEGLPSGQQNWVVTKVTIPRR